MLKKLLPPGLYARLREAYADPCHPDPEIAETFTLYDGQTGEEIKEVKSAGMIRVDRNRMRKLCKTGLPVQYEKALSNLSYSADGKGVTAQFLDGTTATGDILIGSDGARSAVREQLLGTEKAKLTPGASIIMRTTVNFHDAEKALHARTGGPILKMGFHPSTGKMLMVGSE
jgi:flavin-dependent dehydrogenase